MAALQSWHRFCYLRVIVESIICISNSFIDLGIEVNQALLNAAKET